VRRDDLADWAWVDGAVGVVTDARIIATGKPRPFRMYLLLVQIKECLGRQTIIEWQTAYVYDPQVRNVLLYTHFRG